MFLVKDDCKEYGIADRSWTCEDEQTKAPDGYRWTCAARKKDIAWQAMYDWELEQEKQRYARLVQAFETRTLPKKTYGTITEDGIQVFGEYVYHKGETEEEFLAQLKTRKYPIYIYAFLKDGIWTTKECYISDGENSRFEDNGDWEDELEQFIDGLDDETVLVSVDCHM